MKLADIIAFGVNPLRDMPADKQGHFIVGLLAYMVFHFISVGVALIVVAVMAVGKEIHDWFHRDRHTPDLWDAVATMAGGVAGYICGL
jgi:hypothetical protein